RCRVSVRLGRAPPSVVTVQPLSAIDGATTVRRRRPIVVERSAQSQAQTKRPERKLRPFVSLPVKRLLGFFFLCRFRDGDGLADVADLEAREALHRDVLAQLADFRRDELADGNGLLLDEGLLVEADLLVELA